MKVICNHKSYNIHENVMFSGETFDIEKLKEDLITSLNNSSTHIDQQVIQATEIPSLKSWPDKSECEGFGTNEVISLTNHFSSVLENQNVEVVKIIHKWKQLKASMYLGTWEKKLQESTWPQLNRKFGSLYPNFLSLIDLIITLPPSMAECGKGFSVMKTTKTDWRSCLGTQALNDLMMISLQSEDI